MVEQKSVNVGWQVAFCIIPYLWIYGFYRIEKLRMGIVLVFVSLGGSIGLQMLLPFPYGLVSAVLLGIILPIGFIVNWSKEWNTRILSGMKENEPTIPSKSPMILLQERYAKGEITKEEFDKIKEDLKD